MKEDYLWPYGIVKIVKRKQYTTGEIIFCKLIGDMYCIMTFDKDHNLLDAYTRLCDKSIKKKTLKSMNSVYNKQKEYIVSLKHK